MPPPARAGLREPGPLPASPIAHAGKAHPTRHRQAAPTSAPARPSPRTAAAWTVRRPSSSLHRSFSPCRSVKVRTSFAAILVHFTGLTVMPRSCCSTATSKRAKCISLTTSAVAHQPLEVGAVEAASAQRGRDQLHHVGMAVAARHLHQAQPVAMRIEPHRFGIDRNDGPQDQAFRQIVPVKVDGAVRHELCDAHLFDVGAQEKTRTSTTLRPQVPETCASTNSATWATVCPRDLRTAVGRAM